ncbi:SAM-dependent methyltransferase [Fundidesulfovibrio soli]|uniref:SAM-dependent methyltransferase n=1 Tax=Fundidesulfovibrio soli TaxID=2922716 RepID=UPI003014A1FE
MDFTVYLAPKGFVNELVYELGDVSEVVDRLVFAPGPPRRVAWAQNIWLNPRRIPITSIGDGVAKLKSLQRNWALWSVRHHRRAKLIEEQLPAVRPKPVAIGTQPPRSPLGSWTMLDRDTIIASPACSSPFPHGEVEFLENKVDPPNRAYLKLWELFTLLETAPKPGSFCLDLGGSPGGWTWVLASLGCKVLSVDKAPLEPRIEAMPGVEFRMLSAFALDPRETGPVDWLFSDVICYPDRLWRLVERWQNFGKARNFVCTLKFQNPTDHETAAKFWGFPGSRLVHLYNNKHELTWVYLDPEEYPDFAPPDNRTPLASPFVAPSDRPVTIDTPPAPLDGEEAPAPGAEPAGDAPDAPSDNATSPAPASDAQTAGEDGDAPKARPASEDMSGAEPGAPSDPAATSEAQPEAPSGEASKVPAALETQPGGAVPALGDAEAGEGKPLHPGGGETK